MWVALVARLAPHASPRPRPDGYTLLLHHIGLASSAALYRKLPYDTATAFAPIGLVTDIPMTIVAKSDFPANSIGELLDYIRTNKDQVSSLMPVSARHHTSAACF